MKQIKATSLKLLGTGAFLLLQLQSFAQYNSNNYSNGGQTVNTTSGVGSTFATIINYLEYIFYGVAIINILLIAIKWQVIKERGVQPTDFIGIIAGGIMFSLRFIMPSWFN